jgi:hypothetical protein
MPAPKLRSAPGTPAPVSARRAIRARSDSTTIRTLATASLREPGSHDPATLRAADAHYRDVTDIKRDNFTYYDRKRVSVITEAAEALMVGRDSFLDDAAKGELRDVSWIDPNFIDLNVLDPNSNDDHPPSDIRAGQAFILELYEALRRSAHRTDRVLSELRSACPRARRGDSMGLPLREMPTPSTGASSLPLRTAGVTVVRRFRRSSEASIRWALAQALARRAFRASGGLAPRPLVARDRAWGEGPAAPAQTARVCARAARRRSTGVWPRSARTASRPRSPGV